MSLVLSGKSLCRMIASSTGLAACAGDTVPHSASHPTYPPPRMNPIVERPSWQRVFAGCAAALLMMGTIVHAGRVAQNRLARAR